MTLIVIATRNAHKVQEIRQILGDGFRYATLNEFPKAPAVVEDAETFEGNARKKSEELAQWLVKNGTGEACLVLADDSGLEVDALNGAPGVRSARFASEEGDGNSPDAANNAKLLRLLQSIPAEKRVARFRCVMALTPFGPSGAGKTILVDGACEGRIAFSPSGKGGFGYDPLFNPDGHDQSFAELGADIKNRLSHRAKALEKLRDVISNV
jgi:XTP/dITP diphosphohydrolase